MDKLCLPVTLPLQGLGYGVLAGSLLVKVPQIQAVRNSKSATGLSSISFELETLVLAVGAAYGYLLNLPFNAYGEAIALLGQNIVLLLLIYKYQNKSTAHQVTALIVLVTWFATVASGLVNRAQVSQIYDLNSIILIVSRAQQIYQCYREKSTGKLSIITYGLNTIGAAARIFTSLHENAGAAMLRGFGISFVLNAFLLLEITMFGDKEAKLKKKK